ncbi:MAG TPA: CBS domain-containing protein [Rhizomicrobium sp.]|nr:CBS domain-containing protein [Rhizomicrobium sp.]
MPVSLDKVQINHAASIEEAFRRLNDSQMGVLFVVSDSQEVIGCVTDGDIRRLLLLNNNLSEEISGAMNTSFVWAKVGAPREQILKLLDHRVRVVPLLAQDRRLVQVCSREDFHLQDEVDVFARARAPARISFCGGGTDLTHHFFDQGGVVISATITKYAHATLRRRLDDRIRIYSHDLNQTLEVPSLGELKLGGDLDLLKSIIALIKPRYGFELEVSTDFPLGSGLGGSAALAVAIIGCFNEFREDAWTRHQIAEMAFQAERLILNIAGGWQDQYAAAFGGLNYMEFSAHENLIVPLRMEDRTLRELEASTLLCYTRKTHHSGHIHADQKARMQGSSSELEAATRRQKEITLEMKRLLLRGDVYGYGALLDETWQIKKRYSALISDADLDRVYDHAMNNGAVGGKILGAGGGGYFMFFVRPFERFRLCNALRALDYECESVSLDGVGLQSWKMRLPDSALFRPDR